VIEKSCFESGFDSKEDYSMESTTMGRAGAIVIAIMILAVGLQRNDLGSYLFQSAISAALATLHGIIATKKFLLSGLIKVAVVLFYTFCLALLFYCYTLAGVSAVLHEIFKGISWPAQAGFLAAGSWMLQRRKISIDTNKPILDEVM
jgi:hypothetical protein